MAASALSGKISGPSLYEQPEGWSGVILGEGDGIKEEERTVTPEEAFQKVIGQLDSMMESAESEFAEKNSTEADDTSFTEILPGFPERVEGEIIFCDADNINTDGIYPGKYTYQDDVTMDKMATFCMENYDKQFPTIAREGDILVAGFNFGCGSSREQAATAILAKKIPMVVAGSFGNIFSRNSINNALMGVEVPRLIHRLREAFSTGEPQADQQNVTEPKGNWESLDSPPPANQKQPPREKQLTRRTGWKLTWDVRRSRVEVQEGPGGPSWSQKVGELPPNVQEIIARGGLENWVKQEVQANI